MKCPRCGGTGFIPDHVPTGRAARLIRVEAKITLRKIARRLGLPTSYISDIEGGKREWSTDLEARYYKAIREILNAND